MPSLITHVLSLAARPKVVNCGIGEHGAHGREEYCIPRLWSLHLYFYKVQIEVNDESYQILPGSLTLIPPGAQIVYHYNKRRHRHFFVHFAIPACQSPAVHMPVCQHLPEAMDELFDRLENMQRIRTHNALHAEISFWSLLWDLAESAKRTSESISATYPMWQKIEEWIEAGLPGAIAVQTLADKAGLSPTQVNRIIRAKHKLTTIQLIRKRRMQRACHLLLQSTMPIKVVAAESGIVDLQQFNKMMRAEYGKSPRTLRAEHHPNPVWASDRH